MGLSRVIIGRMSPKKINVVIEIPRGTHNKYEYDEELGVIRLDRVMYSAVYYPTDYGFIPQTRSEDGDHLDVLVLISDPLFPGCVVEVRPIGVLNMEDENGRDWKIIAVADKDPRFKQIRSMDDVEVHRKEEIANFFKVYKQLENKTVRVGKWLSQEKAYMIIEDAQERYNREEVKVI